MKKFNELVYSLNGFCCFTDAAANMAIADAGRTPTNTSIVVTDPNGDDTLVESIVIVIIAPGLPAVLLCLALSVAKTPIKGLRGRMTRKCLAGLSPQLRAFVQEGHRRRVLKGP